MESLQRNGMERHSGMEWGIEDCGIIYRTHTRTVHVCTCTCIDVHCTCIDVHCTCMYSVPGLFPMATVGSHTEPFPSEPTCTGTYMGVHVNNNMYTHIHVHARWLRKYIVHVHVHGDCLTSRP